MQQLRLKINEIDKEIATLFNARFKLVKDIKAFKEKHHIPITDLNREKALISENSKYVDEEFKAYFLRFYETLLSLSKESQQ